MPAIVCDASPLVVLAKLGALDAIPDSFSPVMVPRAVLAEIEAGTPDDPIRHQLPSLGWLRPVELTPALSPLAWFNLGRGESEVIEFARLTPGAFALLDDRAARRTASALGIPVVGTLGLLALRVARDPALTWEATVSRLRDVGMYLDEETVRKAAERLGR